MRRNGGKQGLKAIFVKWLVMSAVCAVAIPFSGMAADPALPKGLGGEEEEKKSATSEEQEDEAALPEGLGDEDSTSEGESELALPSGLGGDEATEAEEQVVSEDKGASVAEFPLIKNLSGFWEWRHGYRTEADPYQDSVSVGETRLQLETDASYGPAVFNATVDFLYDYERSQHDIFLEEGRGWIDVRKLNVLLTPPGLPFMDIKAGRQVLTWGTGDLIFINDLFPKDWQSFFIGRDPEYLKAPSDAIKVSLYNRDLMNLDLVYTPRFDADRYVNGRRLSYWHMFRQRRAGDDTPLGVEQPDELLDDDEIAARLFKNIGGNELAFYFYDGFWKSPSGMLPASRTFTFPDLSVYGASLRGNLGKGIAYAEAGYYQSREDEDGNDPFVPNSELRLLLGYTFEVMTNLTATCQYYVTRKMDYDAYERTFPAGMQPKADETNHTVTLRLRKTLYKNDLDFSLFTRYSLTEDDVYFKPRATYKLTDEWRLEAGGNLFAGQHDYSFQGQFEQNSNLYMAVRYSF